MKKTKFKNGFPLVFLLIAIITAIGSYCTAYLSHLKFERKLVELVAQRVVSEVAVVEKNISLGFSLGLANLGDMSDLGRWVMGLGAELGQAKVTITDTSGGVIHAHEQGMTSMPSESFSWKNSVKISGDSVTLVDNKILDIRRQIFNSFGLKVGDIDIKFSIEDIKNKSIRTWMEMQNTFLAAALVSGIVSVIGLYTLYGYFRAILPGRRFVWACSVWSVLVLLVTSVLIANTAYQRYKPIFNPELQKKSQSVANLIANDVKFAIDLGVPITSIPKLGIYLDHTLASSAELAFAWITHPDDQTIASSSLPPQLTAADIGVGSDEHLKKKNFNVNTFSYGVTDDHLFKINIAYDDRYADSAARSLGLDIASVSVIGILLIFEILLLSMSGFQEIQANQAMGVQNSNIFLFRTCLLLFCMSEELARPVMINYGEMLLRNSNSSAGWLVSLPITLFMLFWALIQPFGAGISEKWGRKRSFIAGAIFTACGYLISASTADFWLFLVSRSFCGLGFGLAFISVHGAAIDQSPLHLRASSMALLVGAILTAGVSGPVLGGIVADQVGYGFTFYISAFLALAAALLWMGMQKQGKNPDRVKTNTSAWAGIRSPELFKNKRFISLMVFSALPTKIAATGVVFCLIPVILNDMRATSSDIGKIQMMYFLAFMLGAPPIAALADRFKRHSTFIVLGGGLTVLVLLPAYIENNSFIAILISVFLFGLAQSMIGSPQLTMVSACARDIGISETVAVAWYRLLERFGGAMGPLLMLGIANYFSPMLALLCMGCLCSLSALCYFYLDRHESKSI